MPHCIVEYSRNLENQISPTLLVESVHQGARNSGLFDGNSIKTRALAFDHYQVGNQNLDFIHVTIKILSGRNTEQREALSKAVLNELTKLNLLSISLTVEVRDMERESYSKSVA